MEANGTEMPTCKILAYAVLPPAPRIQPLSDSDQYFESTFVHNTQNFYFLM